MKEQNEITVSGGFPSEFLEAEIETNFRLITDFEGNCYLIDKGEKHDYE